MRQSIQEAPQAKLGANLPKRPRIKSQKKGRAKLFPIWMDFCQCCQQIVHLKCPVDPHCQCWLTLMTPHSSNITPIQPMGSSLSLDNLMPVKVFCQCRLFTTIAISWQLHISMPIYPLCWLRLLSPIVTSCGSMPIHFQLRICCLCCQLISQTSHSLMLVMDLQYHGLCKKTNH